MKKRLDIDIRYRILHKLERKEAVVKFRILSCHHVKRMNLIDLDIYVLCYQNFISEFYSTVVNSIENDKAKISPSSTGQQEEKWCKIQNPRHYEQQQYS